MNNYYRAALGAALLCGISTAQAQTTETASTAPSVVAPVFASSTENILRTGTPIPLEVREALTTEGKKLKVGQRVQLAVKEAVMLNEHIVIPAGSTAVGEVTDVRNKGMWGKSGRINGRVLYVRVGGRQIRLSGQFDDKGVTGTAGVVGAVAFVPVAGFFVTGTSAKIPLGAPVTGFLDEDVTFNIPKPAAAPAEVTEAAPAAPVTQ